MPGIPKVKRCQGCTRRRIKCDMNWPTCTPCRRLNLVCTGPSTLQKFIVNGSHAAASGDDTDATSSPEPMKLPVDGIGPWVMLKSNKSTSVNVSARRGFAHGFFRLSQQPTPTATYRLVSYLVSQSVKSPDLVINLPYLKHIPHRLDQSPALANCVNVICNSWSNFYRGVPADQVIDPTLYGRALRSLHAALNGPMQLRVETLTAMTLLQRVEILFDTNKGQHQSVHSGGMAALMMKRGPPSLDDPLDMHLTQEVQVTLASHLFLHRGDNFFLSSPWVEKLQEVSKRLRHVDDPDVNFHSPFILDVAIGKWPEFVHEMADVHGNTDRTAAHRQAKHLQSSLANLVDEIHQSITPVLKHAYRDNVISEVSCSTSPSGFEYKFATLNACKMLLYYYTTCIAFKVMIHTLNIFQGRPDNALWSEICHHSSQVPKFIPYFRQQGKLASILHVSTLCLAFEGVKDDEKEYIREFILEMDSERKRFPREDKMADEYFIYFAKCLSGRRNFNLTPSNKGKAYEI